MKMIQAENLGFTYPGQSEPTVKGISFTINQGSIFGFLGPSGAGKSTTQKILIRLLQGYTGNVGFKNTPLRSLSRDYYNSIGVGFELPNHYPRLSALENLKFFASFYRKSGREPMELLAMTGLDSDAHRPVGEFSKGMKMRLNFARALLHDPEMIFLDEPTSGLDPVNSRRIKDIILNLRNDGKTFFLTTHNMHDADELCDEVAFLSKGQIAVADSPRKLKLAYGTRRVKVEYGNGTEKMMRFEMDDLGHNPEFLQLIKNETIHSIHSEEASLEDVFIKTTGEKLV